MDCHAQELLQLFGRAGDCRVDTGNNLYFSNGWRFIFSRNNAHCVGHRNDARKTILHISIGFFAKKSKLPHDLASGATSQRLPDGEIDGAGDKLNMSVAEQGMHSANVLAVCGYVVSQATPPV